MKTAKEEVRDLLDKIPDSASLDEIQYHIYVRQKIQKGLDAARSGAVLIDRAKVPNANDEYTPAQRRLIDRGIAKSLKEYRQGRSFGPFETAEELVASLHKQTGRPRSKDHKRTVA